MSTQRAVAMIASFMLGSGALGCMLLLFKGNQIAIAPVLALWAMVQSWPSRRSSLLKLQHMATWCAAAVMWVGVFYVVMNADVSSDMHVISDAITRRLLRGRELLQQGMSEEAVTVFREIDIPECNKWMLAEKHHNLGVALLRLGNILEASQCFRDAIRYDPTNVVAHRALQNIAQRKTLYKERSALDRRGMPVGNFR